MAERRGKPVPDVPHYPLTTAFRTKLYLAHDATSSLKLIHGMVANGNIEKQETANAGAIAEKHAKESQNEIGPEWVKRLKGRFRRANSRPG